MIPLKDDNPTETFPIVTIALIVINVAVFVMQLAYAMEETRFTSQLAVVPVRFFSDAPPTAQNLNPYLTLVSYAFLHGGLLHLSFNMLFLWVFGNNIEDTLGHMKFILFYVLCGVAAAFLHIVMHFDSSAHLVGASGSIAGVLAAYLVLFPYANIHTFFFFIFIIRIIKVPAVLFIGFWFFMQIMNVTGGAKGSTAWFAHIGGFIAGIVLIMLLKPKKKKKKLKIVYH